MIVQVGAVKLQIWFRPVAVGGRPSKNQATETWKKPGEGVHKARPKSSMSATVRAGPHLGKWAFRKYSTTRNKTSVMLCSVPLSRTIVNGWVFRGHVFATSRT